MIYAIIDTNVFVSALFTKNPISATTKIIEAMVQGRIKPLYNEQIMAEYEEVLSRERFHISPSDRKTLFDYIQTNGVFTNRTTFNNLFIDESDRVFYEVALSQEDSFLVTGNLKHYPVDPRVVTPAQMLQILEESN